MKAIVTGHTRGLGAAIAADLLGRGIAVLGLSRGSNAGLAKQFPSLLEQVELDLADSTVLGQWLAGNALARFLSGAECMVLINNAGTVQPVGPLATQDIPAIGRAIGLNVTAPLMLASAIAALPDTAEKRILHVSSGAGRKAVAGWSIYGATKAALDLHALSAAADHAPRLRICSMAPGVIDTDMQAEIRASTPDRFPLRDQFEALKREGDLSSPAECAQRMMDYVLSDRFGTVPVADIRQV